jgi:hypothetical protein
MRKLGKYCAATFGLVFVLLVIFFMFLGVDVGSGEREEAPLTQFTTSVEPVGNFTRNAVLTTTVNDFKLPGTQPNLITDTILSPETCDACHTDPIYSRWRGSMMSQSARDPLMWAALAIANNDAPGAGEYCLRCHVPKGWLEGRSNPTDGSALQDADLRAGIACEICHRLVDPIPSTTDQAVALDATIRAQLELSGTMPLTTHFGSAQMIIDPLDNRRGPFLLNPSPPHPRSTFQTDLMNQMSSNINRARLCGTCHNVDNPALSWDVVRQQYWPNQTDTPPPSLAKGDLFPIERTFDEWLNSDYATTGVFAPQFAGQKPDGIVGPCQDCHLQHITGLAADVGGAVFRDCQTTGCLPEHDLVGGNTWLPQLLQDTRWRLHSVQDAQALNDTITRTRHMLQNAVTLSVTLTTSGTNRLAVVRATNETGHKFPTGYPEGRRAWLNLRAYDLSNNLIYESGAYDLQTGILNKDMAIKIYEVKLGLTPELAALASLPAGESFHFVLNNTYLKDNRIPPRGYTVDAFDQPGLRPVGATYTDGQYWDDTVYLLPDETFRVEVTLYYQTSSKEYIDFLRANGGSDGVVLGLLWDDLKSPPEVVATASSISNTYIPLVLQNQ